TMAKIDILCDQMPIFFFKQKTAYELGLGIPAEPLFRSLAAIAYPTTKIRVNATCRKCPHKVHRMEMKTAISCTILRHTKILIARSEERRVGKEWRYRWAWEQYKKKRVSKLGTALLKKSTQLNTPAIRTPLHRLYSTLQHFSVPSCSLSLVH